VASGPSRSNIALAPRWVHATTSGRGTRRARCPGDRAAIAARALISSVLVHAAIAPIDDPERFVVDLAETLVAP
jgi:hypothetical protein